MVAADELLGCGYDALALNSFTHEFGALFVLSGFTYSHVSTNVRSFR